MNRISGSKIVLFGALLLIYLTGADAQEPMPSADSSTTDQTAASPSSDVLNVPPAAVESDSDDSSNRGTIVIVQGAAGADEFGEQFASWAATWRTVAEQLNLRVHMIGPDSDGVPNRAQLQQRLQASATESQQRLWLVMIGHGTYLRGQAKFNLTGPDVSAEELNEWLKPLQQRPVAIINCASASGPFLPLLSGPNRIVVTSTQSGDEFNFARFGKYLAAAIESKESDVDHDGVVSLLEAFLAASRQTQLFYREESRLATEHALLDDNGDAAGTAADFFRGINVVAAAEEGKNVDGQFAHRWRLTEFEGAITLSDDAQERCDELESQLAELRQQKHNLSVEEYYQRLEPVLVAISKLYQEAEDRPSSTKEE